MRIYFTYFRRSSHNANFSSRVCSTCGFATSSVNVSGTSGRGRGGFIGTGPGGGGGVDGNSMAEVGVGDSWRDERRALARREVLGPVGGF